MVLNALAGYAVVKMNETLKRTLGGAAALAAAALVAGGAYALVLARDFDASMEKVYPVAAPQLVRSADPEVIARGKHLAEAVTSCATPDCHGADTAGGRKLSFGPVGTVQGPNLTASGMGAAYSDGELARLIRHGIKKDGRSLRFMPSGDFTWLPDSDVVAIVSYLRTLPAVDRPNGPVKLGLLGKLLDRKDLFPLDVARRIDHDHLETAPAPEPTARYGKYLTQLCRGCHGEHLSGGPIPGAPPSMAVPTNLTPHPTGLADWTYEDFDRLLTTGVLKNGKKADPMMPYESFGKMDDVEKRALFAYLREVPPLAFGGR